MLLLFNRVALALLTVFATTANPIDVLEKLTATYHQTSNLMYEVDYRFYQDRSQSEPSEQAHLLIHRSGRTTYMKTEGIEMLSSPTMTVIVQEEEREVIVAKNSGSETAQQPFDPLQFEQFAKTEGVQIAHSESGGLGKLVLTATEHSKTRMEVMFDANTFLIKKSSIDIEVEDPDGSIEWNHGRIEAIFSKHDLRSTTFPHDFKDFITQKSSGQFVPAGKFKNYKIVQQ